MNRAPILSPRALENILKGNHDNYVSIRVGVEVVARVHKPIAKRFSQVWKSALQDTLCREIDVTFPAEPSNATGSAQGPSMLSPAEKNRRALKFIVQWMEMGGGNPKGDDAAAYPQTRPGLESLLRLAETLEVRELVDRVKLDLTKIRAPRPKRCPKCKGIEHPWKPCDECWSCHEIGHIRAQCPKAEQARQEFLERQKRREERAEVERLWKEAREKRLKVQEERNLKHGIRTGQVAVGDGGKTITRWARDF